MAAPGGPPNLAALLGGEGIGLQRDGTGASAVSDASLVPVDSLFQDGAKPFAPVEGIGARHSRKNLFELNGEEDQPSSSEFEDDGSVSEPSSDSDSAEEAENLEIGPFLSDSGSSFERKRRRRRVESDGEDDGTYRRKRRKRGRQPKAVDGQRGRRSKDAKGSQNSPSVRSIPCFYEGCTYSYKRPGSTIVEISDRPLLLPKKFDGFTIRSCKKHHDKWKHKERRNSCDVCRGLNTGGDQGDTKGYVNATNISFNLCAFCFVKQRDVLQLLPGHTEPTFAEVPTPEGDSVHSEDELKRAFEDQLGPNSGHARTEPTDPDDGKGDDLAAALVGDVPNRILVHRSPSVAGWSLVRGVSFLLSSVWKASTPKAAPSKVTYVAQDPPFQLAIRRVRDDLGLFAESTIPKGTCLGEFTGIVTEKNRLSRSRRHCLSLGPDLEIDASTQGNHFRFVGDLPGSKNVSFEVVDDSVLVFATRVIKKGEQLFAAFGHKSDKEKEYAESFAAIHQFNAEHLSPEEAQSSAFSWFIEEGYQLLNQKSKITVPIEKRFPAKKSIANTHTIKRHSNVVKNETEWGYVAQLERLDLERAREDCWVTFKAGKSWNFDAFQRALNAWKKTVGLGPSQSQPVARPPSPFTRPPSPFARSPSPFKKKKAPAEEKPIMISTVNSVGARHVEEIQYSELVIKFDGALLGSSGQGYAYVFKGYWRGYPVAVRFPALKVPVTEEERQRFIDACSISALIHPNIVTTYACCKREQLCLVMELMNLGNLKQWLVKSQPHVHGMYIPRIALDIARGMEYIHAKSSIHGNLKSSNVLIKGEILDQGLIANLEVKVGDLGAIGDDFSNKRLETEHFTAPECVKTRVCTRESDVFSFGKILCHLFSEGQEEPKSPQEVLSSSHYLALWDNGWKDLITRCTHADPEKRPKFGEILDALTGLMNSSTKL